MYRYKAYDLVIDSEIEFPELIQGEGTPDIYLKFGQIPLSLQGIQKRVAVGQSSVILYDNHACLIDVQDLGLFYISELLEVTVQTLSKSLIHEIRAIFLTVVIPAIFYLRKTIALHGSVIAFENHCILFTGKSGAGKSTIAARLIAKGNKILSDDICIIKPDHEIPFVVPATPQIKLNAEVALSLGYTPSSLNAISKREEKSWINMENHFEERSLPLRAIYEIIPFAGIQKEELHQLEGKDKLKIILDNTYKPSAIEFIDLQKQLFQQSVWLTSVVNVYQLMRPKYGYVNEQHIDYLINQNMTNY